MKTRMMIAALALLASPAFADPLSQEEKGFIVNHVVGLKVMTTCKSYQPVEGGLTRYGDALGVNSDRLLDASMEAFKLAAHRDYDRTLVIPEVTRFFGQAYDEMEREAAADPATFCQKWPPILIEHGIIKKATPAATPAMAQDAVVRILGSLNLKSHGEATVYFGVAVPSKSPATVTVTCTAFVDGKPVETNSNPVSVGPKGTAFDAINFHEVKGPEGAGADVSCRVQSVTLNSH